MRVVPEDVGLAAHLAAGLQRCQRGIRWNSGLGYGFASHFSFTPPEPAIEAYRGSFEPSEPFPESHLILAVTVICAPTDEEADFLAGTMDVMWVRLQKGEYGRLASPEEAAKYNFTPEERAIADRYRSLALIGSPDTVRAGIERLVQKTGADEATVSSMMYGHTGERMRSYQLLSDAFGFSTAASETFATQCRGHWRGMKVSPRPVEEARRCVSARHSPVCRCFQRASAVPQRFGQVHGFRHGLKDLYFKSLTRFHGRRG